MCIRDRIGTKGEFSTDEDGRMVLKIDFAFLEDCLLYTS